MKELTSMSLALFAGVLLGMIFFGGLWWTIQKGVESKSPAILFSGSLLLRMGIALAGFYAVAHGKWQNLLACLLGFFLARLWLTWFVRRPVEARICMVQEGRR